MKKLNLISLDLNDNQLLTRMQMRDVRGGYMDPIYGTPGGNNGNGCPAYCEPMGGAIYCVGVIDGVSTVYTGNCNQYTYNSNLHNACLKPETGNFWC